MALSALLKRIRQVLGLLTLTSFDTSTAEGRSQERYRRAAWTSLATVAAKAITLGTVLISVPLTVHYLGNERYGMWMTISSTIAALAFADLGMGTGLMNAVSCASGRDDDGHIRTAISSAFYMLSAICVVILGLLAACYRFVPWASLFNVKSALARSEAGPAVAVFLICFAVNIPLGIVQRIQMGFQEGFKNNVWQSLGSVIGLVAVIVGIRNNAGLPALVLCMSGGPIVAALINGLIMFRAEPWLIPRLGDVQWQVGRALVASGLCFTLLTFMNILGTQSDSIIIAHVINPSAVAVYSVAAKLFSVTAVFELFVAPFWPAFGEAMARGDHAWARRTINKLIPIAVGAAVLLCAPLVFVGKPIVAVWAGKGLVPPTGLLVAFAAWSVVLSYRGVMSALLNNEQFLRTQVWFFGAASVLSLLLKPVMVIWFREAGAIWASVAAYTLLYAWPARVVSIRGLERMSKEEAQTARVEVDKLGEVI